MRARRPAALRKPARERLGQFQGVGSFEDGHSLESDSNIRIPLRQALVRMLESKNH
jgi:hypothetical protein